MEIAKSRFLQHEISIPRAIRMKDNLYPNYHFFYFLVCKSPSVKEHKSLLLLYIKKNDSFIISKKSYFENVSGACLTDLFLRLIESTRV